MTTILSPSDVHEAHIIVHAIATSGVSYARDLTGTVEGQIFVPQGITRRFDMKPGDTFRARVAPNFADRASVVPWRLIYVDVPPTEVPQPVLNKIEYGLPILHNLRPEPKPRLTDEQIKDRVREEAADGRVWTTREMFFHLFDREVVYKEPVDKAAATTIGNVLRAMAAEGLLFHCELYTKSTIAHAVYFCSDMAALKPEGFR